MWPIHRNTSCSLVTFGLRRLVRNLHRHHGRIPDLLNHAPDELSDPVAIITIHYVFII